MTADSVSAVAKASVVGPAPDQAACRAPADRAASIMAVVIGERSPRFLMELVTGCGGERRSVAGAESLDEQHGSPHVAGSRDHRHRAGHHLAGAPGCKPGIGDANDGEDAGIHFEPMRSVRPHGHEAAVHGRRGVVAMPFDPRNQLVDLLTDRFPSHR